MGYNVDKDRTKGFRGIDTIIIACPVLQNVAMKCISMLLMQAASCSRSYALCQRYQAGELGIFSHSSRPLNAARSASYGQILA